MPEIQNNETLLQENEQLRARLEELEETLHAIRSGEVDALVVLTPQGEQIFTLQGADEPYRIMVEAMSEGAVTLAQDGTILYCNGHFAELVKTPHEQVVGQPLQRMLAAQELNKLDAILAQAGQGIVYRELVLRARDGTQVPAYFSMYPLPENVGRGIATVVTDLTEVNAAAEEIRRLNATLEQRVIERTAKLEAANRDLESFAYSVSHDLRVPLRAVDGFSRMLLKHYADELDDEGRRQLNIVRDNAVKMSQLIDDILAYSRMGRMDVSMTQVDMDALAREVLKELAPDFAGRQLNVEIKTLPPCHGDLSMLRQVWANLLSNAIKFTRHKAAALIEVAGHVHGDEVVYQVKDNGAGFDMQYADKLFGVFQRLHRIEDFEGTGIGLAIVKRIVTRHDGRVWAEGKVDEGATFYFALPNQGRKT